MSKLFEIVNQCLLICEDDSNAARRVILSSGLWFLGKFKKIDNNSISIHKNDIKTIILKNKLACLLPGVTELIEKSSEHDTFDITDIRILLQANILSAQLIDEQDEEYDYFELKWSKFFLWAIDYFAKYDNEIEDENIDEISKACMIIVLDKKINYTLSHEHHFTNALVFPKEMPSMKSVYDYFYEKATVLDQEMRQMHHLITSEKIDNTQCIQAFFQTFTMNASGHKETLILILSQFIHAHPLHDTLKTFYKWSFDLSNDLKSGNLFKIVDSFHSPLLRHNLIIILSYCVKNTKVQNILSYLVKQIYIHAQPNVQLIEKMFPQHDDAFVQQQSSLQISNAFYLVMNAFFILFKSEYYSLNVQKLMIDFVSLIAHQELLHQFVLAYWPISLLFEEGPMSGTCSHLIQVHCPFIYKFINLRMISEEKVSGALIEQTRQLQNLCPSSDAIIDLVNRAHESEYIEDIIQSVYETVSLIDFKEVIQCK